MSDGGVGETERNGRSAGRGGQSGAHQPAIPQGGMRGGRREVAGRPKGAKGQRTVAVEQAMRVVSEEELQKVA